MTVVAVGGTGGGVGEALNSFVLGRHQNVQKTVDVGLVGGDGVLDGTGHGAEGGLVKDVIGAGDGFFAVFQVADVAFDEGETSPLVCGDSVLYFAQIVVVASSEVVQAHYCLIQFEQGFQQVGADETGYASD